MSGADFELHWAFWQRAMSLPLPVLHFPLDCPRPARQTYEAQRLRFRISSTVMKAVNLCSKQEDVSVPVFMQVS